tara:strand:+ start:462 stop:1025 length:564 start_codon:yes stop_codon:yes gene_type:complete
MKLIKEKLLEISTNFINLSNECSQEILEAANMIIDSLDNNGKVIFCGNGGSAADAQHLSAEFVGRFLKNRQPLASLSLTTDTSAITAIGNDFSFDEIFSRQLEAIGNKGDILYAISTSGKSKNILKALQVAKKLGIKTIGITSVAGKDLNKFCDITIEVPSRRTDRIQEMHIATGHIICEIVENKLC